MHNARVPENGQGTEQHRKQFHCCGPSGGKCMHANVVRGIKAGHLAALTSAIALAVMGWIEKGRPAAPLNGPSQWLWGTQASKLRRADLRHTAVGYGVHHASSIFWGLVHNEIFPQEQSGSMRKDLVKAA